MVRLQNSVSAALSSAAGSIYDRAMLDVPSTVTSFLSALRSLPLWIILALALAGYAVLFAPPFGPIDIASFRKTWGTLVWIEAISFTALFLVGASQKAIDAFREQRRAHAARRILRLIPLHGQRWWHLAKQHDDTFASQIRFDCQVTNTTDRSVQFVKVRLIRPRAKQLIANVLLPQAGSPYHSQRHSVPPHGTLPASVHIMVRGALATQGKPICITVGFTDQFGEEYKLRRLTINSSDARAPLPDFRTRLHVLANRVAINFRIKKKPPTADLPAMPWTFEPGADYLFDCQSILTEEQRIYAARGRSTGQLGSLNVGLQSEPNFGVTTVGTIPSLLWPHDRATQLSSPNLDRLLTMHSSLAPHDAENLENYLLCQLSTFSPFADVAYFVFLALHRMHRTTDALTTARTWLAGDKVYGYSNLLGTLSALISHEHREMDTTFCQKIRETIPGSLDEFRLKEKLNLVHLECLDRGRQDTTEKS